MEEGCRVCENATEVVSQEDSSYCSALGGFAVGESRFLESRKREFGHVRQ